MRFIEERAKQVQVYGPLYKAQKTAGCLGTPVATSGVDGIREHAGACTSSETAMLWRNWHLSGAHRSHFTPLSTGVMPTMRALPTAGRNLDRVMTAMRQSVPPNTRACTCTLLSTLHHAFSLAPQSALIENPCLVESVD
jgi:hypothetical protein